MLNCSRAIGKAHKYSQSLPAVEEYYAEDNHSGREPGGDQQLEERLTQLLDLPTVAPPLELDHAHKQHGGTVGSPAAACCPSLTLDCDAVAAALGSLPLHQVLDLDPQLFALAGEKLVSYGDVGDERSPSGEGTPEEHSHTHCIPTTLMRKNLLLPSGAEGQGTEGQGAEGQMLTSDLVPCINSKRQQQLCQKRSGGLGQFDFWPHREAHDSPSSTLLELLTVGDQFKQPKLTVKSVEPHSLPLKGAETVAVSIESSRTSAPLLETRLNEPEDELEQLLVGVSVGSMVAGSPAGGTTTSSVVLSQSSATTAQQKLDARQSDDLSACANSELLDDVLDELLA